MGIPFLNQNFSGTNKLTCKCLFIVLNQADQHDKQQTAMNAFPCIEFHWCVRQTQPVSLTGSTCYVMQPLSDNEVIRNKMKHSLTASAQAFKTKIYQSP